MKLKDHYFKKRCTIFQRVWFWVVISGVLGMLGGLQGCMHHPLTVQQPTLPLPPIENTGTYHHQFIDTQYGFGIPLPPYWESWKPFYLNLSEVGYFTDPARQISVQVLVEQTDASEPFSAAEFIKDQKTSFHGTELQWEVTPTTQTLVTSNPKRAWTIIAFQIEDYAEQTWERRYYVLKWGNILLVVQAQMKKSLYIQPEGQKIIQALTQSLSQITWYLPIGSRGIPRSCYELDKIKHQLMEGMKSFSDRDVQIYFSPISMDAAKWRDWYRQFIGSDSAHNAQIHVKFFGLVINHQEASMAFLITKKGLRSFPKSHPVYLIKFRFSKKSGHWQIMYFSVSVQKTSAIQF